MKGGSGILGLVVVVAFLLTPVEDTFASAVAGNTETDLGEAGSFRPGVPYVVWVSSDRAEEFFRLVLPFEVVSSYEVGFLAKAVVPLDMPLASAPFSLVQDYDTVYIAGVPYELPRAQSMLENAMVYCGTPSPYAWVVRFVGPVKEEWLRALRERGAAYYGYLPLFSHLVRFPEGSRSSIASLPYVQALFPYASPFKLPRPEAFPESSREWNLLYFDDAPEDSARLASVGAMSVLGQWSSKDFKVVRVQAGRDDLLKVACTPQLFAALHAYGYDRVDEVASEIVGGADPGLGSRVNALGYQGYRILASVIDGGLDDGSTSSMHPDLSGRIAGFLDYAEADSRDGVAEDVVDGHGTHVAGIAAGNGASGTRDANGFYYGAGVAPQASILAQRVWTEANVFRRWKYDKYGVYMSDQTWAQILQEAELRGVTVNNDSWGMEVSSVYGFDAAEFDGIVRDANPSVLGDQPMTVVVGAGRSGGAARTIWTPGTAKNVITVGASKNYRPDRPQYGGFTGWDAANQNEIAPFSNFGPTEAGMLTDVRARASTEGPVTPPGTVVADWTLSADADWAIAAAAFRPAVSNIVFDSSSSDQGFGSSLSWSHMVSGTDRLLVVGVGLRIDASQTVSSVTYAGSALTFLRAENLAGSIRAEMWYKVAPSLGPNNIVITLSAPAKSVHGAVSFQGVHQSAPLDVNVGTTGTGRAPSVTMITVQDRVWVVDIAAFRASGINWPTAFPGTGQVQRWGGHTEDGRIKPDLVAPGTWISSADSSSSTGILWGPITGAPQHLWSGGTSMATPHVTGGAMLFQEFYRNKYGGIPSPALVRAALINGAVDMPDTGTAYATPAIPNHQEGWGRLNLENVLASPLPVYYFDQDWPLSQGEVATFAVSASSLLSPMRVTLVWTDAPAVALCDPCLINNLDLEVVSPSGDSYKGNTFDSGWSVAGKSHWDFSGDGYDDRNNVENLYLQAPASGKYLVKVRATAVNADVRSDTPGVNQDFALVISNGDAQLSIAAFSINGGAIYTNNPSVQLTTTAQHAENAYQMRLRNEATQSWTQVPYSLESDHGDGWGDLTYVLEPWDPMDTYDQLVPPSFYRVVESQHPYPSQVQTTSTPVQGNVDTVRMRVGFRRIELVPGDTVTVRDCRGTDYTWSGTQKNVWTPDILNCNSITIIFKTLGGGSAWGFYSETYIYASTSGGSYPPNYSNCWIIDFNEKRRNDNHRVRIHLEYLDTYLDGFPEDYLAVYDSVGFRGTIDGIRSDIWLPDALNIGIAHLLGDVKLCFVSDGDGFTGTGFRVDHYDHFVGYPRGAERRWVVKQPGVAQIQVHFASRDVSTGDILEVRDSLGTTYTIGADGWSAPVPGDTLFIRRSSDFDYQTGSGGATPAGFVVDAIKVYDYAWSLWETFATTRNGWVLSSGDGTKTVWIQVRDRLGKVADGSDQIVLDTQRPSQTTLQPPPNCFTTISDATPTFSWSVFDDPAPSSGLKWFHFEVSTDPAFTTLSVHAHPTGTSYTTPSLPNGVHYVRVRAEDNAGNEALSWSNPNGCWVDIQTVNNGVLQGTVYDSLSPPGPVEGATVKVYRDGNLIATTTTNSDGYYQITNLPTQATLHVEVTKACYTWNPQNTEIPVGGTVTLNFYATWQCT